MAICLQIGGTEIPASDIKLKSENGKASFLTARFPKGLYEAAEGEQIALYDGNELCFCGYIFTLGYDALYCEARAYDQIRYLMFKDSYVFKQKKVGEIVSSIAKDMGLVLGQIEQGTYAMELVVEDKKLLDTIHQAIGIEKENSGQELVLFDDGGKLCLGKKEGLVLDLVLDGESAVTGYEWQSSIDKDSFNRVKLAQKNKKKGLRTISVAQGGSVSDWGTLQYYESVDEKLDEGQVKAMAQSILKQKNRAVESLVLEAVGQSACRAGYCVSLNLDEASGLANIEKAEQHWDENGHRMKLHLKMLEGSHG